jgi:hypothetical protein
MANTSSAPPAPTMTASMAIPFATSPAQPSQLWVTRPTSMARWRAIALAGSVTAVTATDSATAVAAPATTGRFTRAFSRAGGRRTTHTRSPSSSASRTPKRTSWPLRKSSARSMNSALK